LIVFRTSQSYARFWEGTTAVFKMRSEYLDACGSLMAFCRHSKAPEAQIKDFKQLMVRLFSMLFALALGELDTEHEAGKRTAFQHGLLDAEGIDERTLRTLRDSDHQTCVVHQWIQQLIVEHIGSGVLTIPPPILSRVFNEMANGMCAFEQAMKISVMVFPFPYTQVCDAMLFIHWVCAPWVVAGIAPTPMWAFVLTFLQVFVLWALNITAKELQQPYGVDATDLDGHALMAEMNRRLELLIHPACSRLPRLSGKVADYDQQESWNQNKLCGSHFARDTPFTKVWQSLPSDEIVQFQKSPCVQEKIPTTLLEASLDGAAKRSPRHENGVGAAGSGQAMQSLGAAKVQTTAAWEPVPPEASFGHLFKEIDRSSTPSDAHQKVPSCAEPSQGTDIVLDMDGVTTGARKVKFAPSEQNDSSAVSSAAGAVPQVARTSDSSRPAGAVVAHVDDQWTSWGATNGKSGNHRIAMSRI